MAGLTPVIRCYIAGNLDGAQIWTVENPVNIAKNVGMYLVQLGCTFSEPRKGCFCSLKSLELFRSGHRLISEPSKTDRASSFSLQTIPPGRSLPARTATRSAARRTDCP